MRIPLLFLATALVLSHSTIARADDHPLVLPLYPAEVPGEAGSIPAETIKGAQGHRQISSVSQPSLTVYLPPKEKNTGAAIVIAPESGYNILGRR